MLLHRLRYLAAKIRRAWRDGTLREKGVRFLIGRVRIPWVVCCRYCRLAKPDRRMPLRAGFVDHRQNAKHHRAGQDHLRRIIAAYKAARQAQPAADDAFQIRGLWREWLEVNYKRLIAALENEDLQALGALLDNFNREQFAVGTGGSGYDSFIRYRASLTGRAYIKTVWCDYRDKYASLGMPFENVHAPWVGNPAGVRLNGSVIQINAFRHAYHGAEIRELLRDVPGAVVVEIGSGFGGQACQTIGPAKGAISKYMCFDIPLVASVCSYYLLSTFPDRRIRLYGEGPVSTAGDQQYDLAIFPHFAITQLAPGSVDLFHNANSFSEMDGSSSLAYLSVMERACRRYISHINHDISFQFPNPDGSVSRNVIGSKLIPDPSRFKRVFKKPRVFGLPEDVFFPSFEYLYQSIENPSGNVAEPACSRPSESNTSTGYPA